MKPLFTALGEILVDFTPVVEAGRTVGFRMHPGGSPYNVAVALARLGARVEFAGKASTDFFGRFLVGHLQREGVGMRFLSRSRAPSTLAFVALEGDEPSFSFYGEGAADTLLRPEDLPEAIAQTDILHFGSISLVREPAAGTIAALVDRLRGSTLLSCDPNIRPGLIGDPVTYRNRLMRLFASADVVKISGADLRWLDPDRDTASAAAALLALGPALVVVTLGAQGCSARSEAVEVQLPAVAVEVVDTVGAGDAFTAGLLFRLGQHGVLTRASLVRMSADTVKDALRFATVAAALACTRAGADAPRLAEVEALLRKEPLLTAPNNPMVASVRTFSEGWQ